jgi:hypothetical protein
LDVPALFVLYHTSGVGEATGDGQMRWILVASLTVSAALLNKIQVATAQAAESEAKQGAISQAFHLPMLSAGDERFWIVMTLVLLMGALFVILFWWQKHIEQAGYFANIFQDTIANIETNRLSQPYHRNWSQHVYWDEIAVWPSPRGQKWLDQETKNKRPEPKLELTQLAEKLGLKYEVVEATQDLDVPPFAVVPGYGGRNPFSEIIFGEGSRTGNLLPGRSGSGIGRSTALPGLDNQQPNPDQLRFLELLKEFRQEVRAWARRAGAEAWSFYQDDLKHAQKEGRKQPKRAITVDLSALRGRGPEFVLEFTAIVVIIFAAVILGVIGLLGDQQIGTLLAAIAGYVLGKSVARGRSGQTEESSEPDQSGKERHV